MPKVLFGFKTTGRTAVTGQGFGGVFQCFLHRCRQGVVTVLDPVEPATGSHQGRGFLQVVQVALHRLGLRELIGG